MWYNIFGKSYCVSDWHIKEMEKKMENKLEEIIEKNIKELKEMEEKKNEQN